VRPGTVVKPKNARRILTTPDQAEIARGQQVSSGFSQRRKQLLSGTPLPLPLELQTPVSIRYQLQMTPRFREECIEGSWIGPLSCFPLLYESADCCAQSARGFEQGRRPTMCQIILNRPAGTSEPSQNVAAALEGIDEFSVNTGDRIQDVQSRMIAQHRGFILRKNLSLPWHGLAPFRFFPL
jgi:hypothetical protein